MKTLFQEKSSFRRSECRENTYVRVVGNMKALSEGKLRNVMAFNISPVKDFNEITFHFLDVIYAKLSLDKVRRYLFIFFFLFYQSPLRNVV